MCGRLLLSICFTVFLQPLVAQISPEQERVMDSLLNCVNNAPNDHQLVVEILELDYYVYYMDSDSSLKLNQRVADICRRNLAKDLDPDAERHFKHYLVESYNNMGLSLSYQGHTQQSMELHKKGLKLAKEIGDTEGTAMAHNNLALVHEQRGEHVQALENFGKALELAIELQNTVGQSTINLAMGEVYMAQGEYETALDHFNQGYTIAESTGDNFGLSQAMKSVATALLKQGKLDMALNHLHAKLELDTALLSDQGYGNAHDLIGLVFMEKGDMAHRAHNSELALSYYHEARDHFQIALENREGIDYLHGIIMTNVNLGKIHLRLNEPDRAAEYSSKAHELASEIGHLEERRDAAESLYLAYRKLGMDSKALDMYEDFIVSRDSLLNAENIRAGVRRQYEYSYARKTDSVETERKLEQAEQQRQQDIADKEAERKNVIIYSGAAGLLLIILFAVFVVNRLRITRKQKATIELQKEVVEEKNKEILDSIQYAKRLQEAILPPTRLVKEWLPQSFILYKPKDIVAGDFYWMETIGDVVYFSAADCTGHGVPGAMVSVVCSNALSKALIEEGITDPGKILDRTRELVIDRFERSEEEVKDGMDISLCALNMETSSLQWAGANNPLWLIRRGAEEIEEIKADKQPIGKYGQPKPFTTHQTQLNPGDALYIFSDGFPDQFGGERGKKYKSGQLKRFFLSIQNHEMLEQRTLLSQEFDRWKGDIEQIDDVCVIGVKI